MDLHFTDEQEAFRAEARAWLAEHAPPARSLPSLDTAEGFEAHRAWEQTMFDDRWSVVSWPEAFGGRGVGILEWLDLRGGVLAGRSSAPGEPERGLPAGPDDVRVRHRGPAGAVSPGHGLGPGDLVPGLVRARRRLRSGRHPQPGPSASGRRWMAALGPEDLGLPRGLRRVVLRPVPDRPRCGAPPRTDVLPHRPEHTGRHGATDPSDRRRDRLRRAVLRGRVRP